MEELRAELEVGKVHLERIEDDVRLVGMEAIGATRRRDAPPQSDETQCQRERSDRKQYRGEARTCLG